MKKLLELSDKFMDFYYRMLDKHTSATALLTALVSILSAVGYASLFPDEYFNIAMFGCGIAMGLLTIYCIQQNRKF